MRVTAIRIGNVVKVELPDGATVADLLCKLNMHNWDDIDVRVDDTILYPDSRLSDEDTVLILRGIMGAAPLPPGRVEAGVRELRKFTAGARELILIDPYILKTRINGDYVQLMSHSTNVESGQLKNVHLIYSWRHHNADTLSRLTETFGSHGCSVTHTHTDEIHDRLWIKDEEEAIAVGTSLNAVGGGRLAFVLKLPDSDLEYVMDFLEGRNLLEHGVQSTLPK